MNSVKVSAQSELELEKKKIKIKGSIKANNIEGVNKSGKKQWYTN